MFKILSVLAFIGLFNGVVQAQTLSFSSVILVSSVQTVPAGKVWKITGALPNAGNPGTGTSALDYTILVNGNTRYIGNAAIGRNSSSSWGFGVPQMLHVENIWLPANTTLAAGQGIGELSVIEFNIIP